MKSTLICLPLTFALADLVVVAVPASAQVKPITGEAEGDPEAGVANAGTPAAAPTATNTAAEPVKSAGAPADKLRIPAPDESVYVVQKRAFSKSGKFETDVMVFTSVNPKFVGYVGAAVSASYHFQENLALEFSTAAHPVGAFYSDLVYEVWKYEQLMPEEVDLKQILYFNSLALQFSALYGKFEFYGYLVDYDFFVSGGLGYALTREPCDPGTGHCTREAVDVGRGLQIPDRGFDAHKITGNLGFGLRVFFHEMVGARIEFRNIAFADRKVETEQTTKVGQTTTDIRNTMMLMLGLSLMFG